MANTALRKRYRAVFLSDLHLGASACRAEALLTFLDDLECERLYLLGDIVDGWRLQRRWRWPASHAAVIDGLRCLARSGTEMFYIPGNHDGFARAWCGEVVAGIRIEAQAVHEAADGRRYLLVHGDLHDPAGSDSSAAQMLGDVLYRALLRTDRLTRALRRTFGLTPWSFAAAVKTSLPQAVQAIAAFEAALATQARLRGLDGVVCGHIHSAQAVHIDGVNYINCGDWVESCSAAVEHFDGAMEIVHADDIAPVPCRKPQPVRRFSEQASKAPHAPNVPQSWSPIRST